MSNGTDSAFAADLAATVATPRNVFPSGKPIMEQVFEACGEHGEEVRRLLISRELKSGALIRLLKRQHVEPIPGESTVRQWVLAQGENA